MYREFLESTGVQFDPGLSAQEVRQIEEQFCFVFPPDLRELLMSGMPIGDKFPNWRNSSYKKLKERLEWPYEGICFDIEHNSFWPKSWGSKPRRLIDAFQVARSYVDQAPKLIPIYSHRYIPDRPNESGNPVFSVFQTDIIIYGADLASYLKKEFGDLPTGDSAEKIIEFWSSLVEYNNES